MSFADKGLSSDYIGQDIERNHRSEKSDDDDDEYNLFDLEMPSM